MPIEAMIQQVSPMSYLELQKLTKKTYEAISKLDDPSTVDVFANTATITLPELQIKKIIENLLKKLLEQKNRFAHVFATELGSTYFVTQDGQSLRFRVDRRNGQMSIQPIMKNIFFIDESGFEIVKNAIKMDFYPLFHNNVPIFEPQVGLYPLELNSESSHGEIVFEKTPTKLMIKGSRYRDEEIQKQIFGGLHIGHKITKIF